MQSVVKEEPMGRQVTSTSGSIVSLYVAGAAFHVIKLPETSHVGYGQMFFRPASYNLI